MRTCVWLVGIEYRVHHCRSSCSSQHSVAKANHASSRHKVFNTGHLALSPAFYWRHVHHFALPAREQIYHRTGVLVRNLESAATVSAKKSYPSRSNVARVYSVGKTRTLSVFAANNQHVSDRLQHAQGSAPTFSWKDVVKCWHSSLTIGTHDTRDIFDCRVLSGWRTRVGSSFKQEIHITSVNHLYTVNVLSNGKFHPVFAEKPRPPTYG